MEYDRQLIIQKLQSALSPKRFIHTLGTEEAAIELAEIYNIDVNIASLTALLHDCAKDIPRDMSLRLCKQYHIDIIDPERYYNIVHSFLGAEIAKREYGVENHSILDAIKYHTTGREKMTLLEKIIFIADYIETNRKPIPGLEEIRQSSKTDIDKAMYLALQNNINFINSCNGEIYYLSLEALRYYEHKNKH